MKKIKNRLSFLSDFSLLRFIIICCNSLLAFSPKLIDQLTAIDFDATKWQPLIEIQFTAPKLNVTTPFPQLTFGTVLNAAVVFTKAMNIVRIRCFYSFYIFCARFE